MDLINELCQADLKKQEQPKRRASNENIELEEYDLGKHIKKDKSQRLISAKPFVGNSRNEALILDSREGE